jgi:hypothetical protein
MLLRDGILIPSVASRNVLVLSVRQEFGSSVVPNSNQRTIHSIFLIEKRAV